MTTTQNSVEFRAFEHEGWQGAADGYAKRWVALTSQAAPYLLNAVKARTGTTLLDIAFGPGHLAATAHERGAVVVGIDFSREMVQRAKATYPDVDFREGDAETLAFDDESFDAVVMSFGLLHLAQPQLALREAARVLRPAGHFAFTVWAKPERALGFRLALDAVAKYGNKVHIPQGPDFFTYSTASVATAALEDAGLINATSTEIPLTWPLDSPQDVFKSFFEGTARTGALLRQQDAAIQTLIAKEMTKQAQAFVISSGQVEIPMPAVMSVGTKPLE